MEPTQIAEYVCIGGPLDGERHECRGRTLVVPLVTEEYQRAYGEWLRTHGVAWIVETVGGIPEHPKTTPPPSYPTAYYDLQRGDDGEFVLRHIDGPEGDIQKVDTDG